MSAYELHAADFGSSPDRVFASQERHPYVAGEFVWIALTASGAGLRDGATFITAASD